MEINRRNYSLDFLKICATILIVLHHYQQVSGARFEYVNFYEGRFYFGYIVELFFVLSGYFISRYSEKIKGGAKFSEFFKRRAARLLPLVSIAVVCFDILMLIYKRVFGASWLNIEVTLWGSIVSALGIQDGWGIPNPSINNPTWYVSVLLLCYCIFYFLNYLSNRCKLNVKYLYVLMIFMGIGILTYNLNLPFINNHTARGYYAFFFGVLLKEILEKIQESKFVIIVSFIIWLIIPLMIVYVPWFVNNGINYIMTFIFYPSVIILLNTNFIKRVFNSKIFGKLSEISFDVYIWHVPVFLAMILLLQFLGITIDFNRVEVMLGYLLLTFFIGTISYLCIESPINKYLRKKGV